MSETGARSVTAIVSRIIRVSPCFQWYDATLQPLFGVLQMSVTQKMSAVSRERIHPESSSVIPRFKNALTYEVTMLPNGWGVAVMSVTPELAAEMLAHNHARQRTSKLESIRRYSEDMQAGKWELTHQGIAFDKNHDLFDGQNRLQAVIASGETVEMLVFFGVGHVGATREMEVIDTHKVRSVLDAAKVADLSISGRMNTMMNAAIRYGVKNGGSILRLLSQSARLDAIGKWDKELKEVDGWFGHTIVARSMAKAPITAAVFAARLQNGVDPELLQRFVKVLIEEADAGANEKSPVFLRQIIQANGPKMRESEIFLKTCKAIQLFLQGRDAGIRLYACQDNPFPIPTEHLPDPKNLKPI